MENILAPEKGIFHMKDESKTFLSREAILAIQDIPSEDVFVPEWNTWVRVRGLTGAERDAFEEAILAGRGKDTKVNLRNIRAKLVAKSVVDPETGQYLFSEEDLKALGRKSARALARIYDVAQRLAGITKADEEELAGTGETSEDS